VILHGRNATKLGGIKQQLEGEYGVSVRVFVWDAEEMPTGVKGDDYERFDSAVQDVVRGVSLTVLVNNIGFLGRWMALKDRDPLWLDRQIAMNVRFMAQLTRVLVPVLVENSPGLVINVSSGGEALPMPWSVPYAGAKGWSAAFNRSLKYEMAFEGYDVEVLGLKYSFMCTPSTGRTDADAKWDCPTSRDAARAGLKAIGCGYQAVWPYWGHGLAAAILELMPEAFRDKLVAGQLAEQRKKMDALEAATG
jgi:17beta-estradiol 17-dehydrogenase / very-long-chain 3-oxoacyl-CoA reductase